jgi:release factor glutamine methyltransferase
MLGEEMAAYNHKFRPSPYTSALLGLIKDQCAFRRMDHVLDVGVGSGILLACLARLGAKNLWGIDIDPEAIAASTTLLQEEAPFLPKKILEGDMWSPLAPEQRFDVIVANLPQFPATVVTSDRPKTWGGDEGRTLIKRFIQALPDRLQPDGVAYITHHDLVGLTSTMQCIQSSGLKGETVFQWTVFESPESMSSVNPQVILEGHETLDYIGGYAFIGARILAITYNKAPTTAPCYK